MNGKRASLHSGSEVSCRRSLARNQASQTVTREKVHEKERRETSDRNEVGRGGYRRKKHKDTTASVLAGCNAKEKSSALEKPTCGTLSPETYQRKRSPKFRSTDTLNEQNGKLTFIDELLIDNNVTTDKLLNYNYFKIIIL